MSNHRIALVAAMSLLAFAACDAKDTKAGGGDTAKSGASKSKSSASKKSEDKPGLHMKSDSAVCKKAMKCCEERVKVETGGSKPEDINLKCSGVAMASTDDECKQFAKGYAMGLEAGGKTVPASCKE